MMRASPLWRRQAFAVTNCCSGGPFLVEGLLWNALIPNDRNGRSSSRSQDQKRTRHFMAYRWCSTCLEHDVISSQAKRLPSHAKRESMLGGMRTMAGGARKRSKKKSQKSSGPKQQRSPPKPPKSKMPTASAEVPPAYLMPTASPFVYVASCAAMEFDIDSKSLFEDVMSTDLLPPTFSNASFDYVNPKAFGHELPTWDIPEVAFLGRSNVGKSSLINALMRKDLARCSKHPGRTQQVNYFALVHKSKFSSNSYRPSDATGFLVDLPGYGYAKAPEKNVDKWQQNTQQFFLNRNEQGVMRNVYCLVDARRGTTQFDRTVMGWFDEASIPYSIVLTKADKVGRPQLVRFANDVCMRYHSQLYGDGDEGSQGPIVHITSARTGEGLRELMSSIEADFSSVTDSD